jgi:hypothetical protein
MKRLPVMLAAALFGLTMPFIAAGVVARLVWPIPGDTPLLFALLVRRPAASRRDRLAPAHASLWLRESGR